MTLVSRVAKLAIFGGSPAFSKTSLTRWPAPEQSHLDALDEVIESGLYHRVNHPIVSKLENRLATWGQTNARTVGSGTAALHIALDYLSQPKGIVAVAALNWPGAVGPISIAGMKQQYLDVSLDTACIDENAFKSLEIDSLTAVVVTHLFGNYSTVADHLNISSLTSDIPVIHDCAQALGALPHLSGQSNEWGIALSGNGSKHLGAGELGILCSGKNVIIDHVDRVSLSSSARGGERVFQPNTLSYNYRPNVFSASIALKRLDTIEHQLAQRRDNANYLWHHLSKFPGLLPLFKPHDKRNSFCVLPLRLDPEVLGLTASSQVRDRIVQALAAECAPVSVWLRRPVWEYVPSSVQPNLQDFPNTQRLLNTMFHISEVAPPNSQEQMQGIIEAFDKVWSCIDELRPWLLAMENEK
ncbi:MAG: DegT/DnrJ/EryC1/StrS family aminotransferase [Candidatus Thiodiazotropha endolucinida]|nr:DegT/DnrJ/EryC1/StrS family aminotransferase [Candidatus Thiodiazotropha taylori]MCG8093495.1 DegT/DnrJ/EryC1/StrS family aminotransferase [Candidatus Thiodiazotropha endolucinida]MCG8104537.1 DegT/DnrJ/EryC1/StrS family aminotransferase [Candidatus Thiodiazotropha taylori]MCG8119818.1 DegT/DnrJ/EryC1/StrS family aminotransferase [Candidatus Thiodiazotropha taylori]MCW4262166.1 DegT/DnrJ/EryC1/StrS family aminotransferase [Candidatus Thiodiazotropha endolucinida]